MILFLSLFVSISWAQVFSPSASEISINEAQRIFDVLKIENTKMEERSECFQRAHMWSLLIERIHQVHTEKVFLYFTHKFQMQHRVTNRWGRIISWWFHVAPAVRVNGKLMVMDATFTDQILSVEDWAKSLMKNPETCHELIDLNDYVNDLNSNPNREQCYYTSTPQYIYAPVDMGIFEVDSVIQYTSPTSYPNDWTSQTLNWAVKSYKRKFQAEVRNVLGF